MDNSKFTIGLGKRIKYFREQKGYTIKELANRAQINPNTLSNTEKGKTRIKFSTYCKICYGLGVKLSELVDFEY